MKFYYGGTTAIPNKNKNKLDVKPGIPANMMEKNDITHDEYTIPVYLNNNLEKEI